MGLYPQRKLVIAINVRMHINAIYKSDFESTSAIIITQSHRITLCSIEPSIISYEKAKIRGLKDHFALHFNLVGLNTYRNPQFNQGSGLTISINVKIKRIISD